MSAWEISGSWAVVSGSCQLPGLAQGPYLNTDELTLLVCQLVVVPVQRRILRWW